MRGTMLAFPHAYPTGSAIVTKHQFLVKWARPSSSREMQEDLDSIVRESKRELLSALRKIRGQSDATQRSKDVAALALGEQVTTGHSSGFTLDPEPPRQRR